MIYETTLTVVRRLLEATRADVLHWTSTKDEMNEWFSTTIGEREVCFRFLYFEAVNQAGADPHMIQLHMPGLAANFACGTEGYCLLLELLGTAFKEWDVHPERAIEFLDRELPSMHR